MLGGAMRQVGVLAAAGLYALDNHRPRLLDDHVRAKEISNVLKSVNYISRVEPAETNIIIFQLNSVINSTTFINMLRKKKILISDMGGGKLRMVTHLDYSEKMHKKVLETLKSIL